jgi:hypothetical protein
MRSVDGDRRKALPGGLRDFGGEERVARARRLSSAFGGSDVRNQNASAPSRATKHARRNDGVGMSQTATFDAGST